MIGVAALVALLFGAATIFSGGRVLFGDGAAGAGNYLPYIVWFNFLAGFAYVAASIGLWLRKPWRPACRSRSRCSTPFSSLTWAATSPPGRPTRCAPWRRWR